MTIVIPMAGLSSRFTKAGYVLPKYMLYLVDKSLFNIAVSSFKAYFDTCDFLFIARDVFKTREFIEQECQNMGILHHRVVILDAPTRGQAETVDKGLTVAGIQNSESILIFNIDTFRHGFHFPEDIGKWDGYLEVFKGSGANWSYALTKTPDSTCVIETAEKKEISDNCSTGIYYFRHAELFRDAYNGSLEDENDKKELYVAPIYNRLIASGANIHIHVIKRDEVVFCGIPEEYMDCLAKQIKIM